MKFDNDQFRHERPAMNPAWFRAKPELVCLGEFGTGLLFRDGRVDLKVAVW